MDGPVETSISPTPPKDPKTLCEETFTNEQLIAQVKAAAVSHGRGLGPDEIDDVIAGLAVPLLTGRFDTTRGSLKPFLMKCTVNRIRDLRRMRHVRRAVSADDSQLVDDSRSIVTPITAADEIERVCKVLERLQNGETTVLLRYLVRQITAEVAAGLLGIREEALRKKVQRFVDELRCELESSSRNYDA